MVTENQHFDDFWRKMMLPMPKILLLYAHPESQNSVANKILLQSAAKLARVTVHDLYACYPEFFIDVCHEQQLLRDHQFIVFQHPLYTYSCPTLLKEWFDRVLSRGFASGVGGNALRGKYWRSVITTGEPEGSFYRDSDNRYLMEDILQPFKFIASMCHMHWIMPMIVYCARRLAPAALHRHAKEYVQWLQSPLSISVSSGKK